MASIAHSYTTKIISPDGETEFLYVKKGVLKGDTCDSDWLFIKDDFQR